MYRRKFIMIFEYDKEEQSANHMRSPMGISGNTDTAWFIKK